MTIIQKIQARKAIHRVAKQQGITVAQCRAEMTAAIEDAWASADLITRQRQSELFKSRIPTPEEFIFVISSQIT